MTFSDDDVPLSQTKQATYKKFERQLAGKMGQLVVVAYADVGGKFFRFGRLESEQLVLVETGGFAAAMTLPVSEFHAFEQGSWKVLTGLPERGYEGDIFDSYAGLEHAPPSLYSYLSSTRPSSFIIYLGNEQANHYFRTVEGTELEPSAWMESLMKNGPDGFFLAAVAQVPSSDEIEAMLSVPDA